VSEYQYYEFRALDRPLSDADQRALRKISTRARITATSFTNSYDWGDFRGDPDELMRRWFDLHLCYVDFGSRRLMMRFPRQSVQRETFDCFLRHVESVSIEEHGDNLILDIVQEELEADDYQDDGKGWLANLAPLRADILGGDLRLLYLLWLTAVETGDIDPSEPEPLPGLGPKKAAFGAFVEFFQLDGDLMAAAAERPFSTIAQEAVPRRTAGELRARAEVIREARLRKSARKEAAKLRKRLEPLQQKGQAVWDEIEAEIVRRDSPGYNKARDLLRDLKQLAQLDGTSADFSRRLHSIRERHARKRQLIVRLKDLV
jgi:hypothetical protein